MQVGSDDLRINPDEHSFLVGTTGSGKTELARYLLADTKRTVVIDPKHEFVLPHFRIGWNLPIFSSDIRIICRPRINDDARMARLVMECLRRKNVRIFVDEMETINELYESTTIALSEVARRGRSRRVTLVSATQRPRFVAKRFMTEARVWCVFALASSDDRRHVAGFVGDVVEYPIPLYQFWYKRPGMENPTLLHLDLKERRLVKAEPPPMPDQFADEWSETEREEATV